MRSHFQTVFNEIDADGSGQIDKAEFVTAIANLQQLGDLQVEQSSSSSDLQAQFGAILSRIFDASVRMDVLFDRIDTDHSGHISWDEFWAFVEAEVTAIAGPDLRTHHKERTVHALYAHKAYIHGLWLGMSKISVAKIVAGFRQDPKLDEIYDEVLSSLDVFGAGGAMENELTFDDAWAHIESAIVRIVQAEQFEEIQSSVRSLRDVWKGHFLSVFSAIDVDGNGTIEKEEFQLALSNVARLSQMRVGQVGVAISSAEVQQQFREILAAVFDSKLNASALFERIDVDHSGQISWGEFWEFVEKEVTKVAGPELKKLFVDRCSAELYTKKTELAALFGVETELSEATIIARAKEVPAVFVLLSEVLPAAQLTAMSSFAGKVSFDTFWKHVEEGILQRAAADVKVAMVSEVRTMRDVWRSHFLEVFRAMDTDGSGAVDKTEFLAAVANAGVIGAMPVHYTPFCVRDSDLTRTFETVLLRAFDSAMSDEEIFRKIDTDGSGEISWDEFWTYIKTAVKAQTGADLKEIYQQKCVHSLYTYKAYISSLWTGRPELRVDVVLKGLKAHPELRGVLAEMQANDAVPLLKESGRSVSFETFWQAVEGGMVATVGATVTEIVGRNEKTSRDKWYAHFLSLFNSIDADKSGSISRAELKDALAGLAAVRALKLQRDDTMDTNEQYRLVLAHIFDSRFGADELFAKIDTEGSGRISWDQFWATVSAHVTKSSNPVLAHVFTERCGASIFAQKESLRKLWRLNASDAGQLHAKRVLGALRANTLLKPVVEQARPLLRTLPRAHASAQPQPPSSLALPHSPPRPRVASTAGIGGDL